MQTVYVVSGWDGSESDEFYSGWIIAAYQTEERAREIIGKLERLHKYKRDFRDRQYTEFDKPYNSRFPLPEAPKFSDFFKTNSKSPLPFNDGKGYNKAREKWHRAIIRRGSKMNKARSEWVAANFCPDADLAEVLNLDNQNETDYYSYRYYSYQKVILY